MLLVVKYQNFYFEHTSFDQTVKEVEKLDQKKTKQKKQKKTQVNDIPVK